jgi:hypothetical protein
MFAMGFQSVRGPISLGQALSQDERNHYLFAISRAINEADQIDKWLKDNPTAKLSVPATTPPADVQTSPYFTKWIKFQDVRPDMQKLNDRLSNLDPTTWSSVTSEEHTTFGWVSILDQIFAAFQADPKNMTVGKWQGDTRLPDPPTAAASAAPTILGLPKDVVLIGGMVVGLGILVMVFE